MIRKLELKDYESVKVLVNQVHELHLKNRPDIYISGNSLPKEYYERIINDSNCFNYAYEENNKIIGIITAIKIKNRPLLIAKKRVVYFIDDIVVDNNYRRKGIGKILFNYLLEKAKIDNIDAIELNVWSFNELAIKFYQSLGMTIKNMKMEYIINKSFEKKEEDFKINDTID